MQIRNDHSKHLSVSLLINSSICPISDIDGVGPWQEMYLGSLNRPSIAVSGYSYEDILLIAACGCVL